MKSIWMCFCNVVCTINRRRNATRHLSSMALKLLLQELNHIFLVSEKSVPSKGSCVGCSTGKFYSWVSKIKCAVHKSISEYTNQHLSNFILMNDWKWRRNCITILFLRILPWTWKITGYQHEQGNILFSIAITTQRNLFLALSLLYYDHKDMKYIQLVHGWKNTSDIRT